MNNKTDIDVQYVSPLKKICMTIGELPSSYLETMSYYEMLVWFTEYIKNTLIPTINNNAEAVQELQSLYEELRTYVNDYFDNLDVQEEINNKLDALVEDGTLTSLIGNYIQPLIDEQNAEINEFKNSTNSTLQTMDTKITNIGSGSPLVVSNTSAMTDTTRVYVNSTDGKWYYYNGSAWTVGGSYLTDVDYEEYITDFNIQPNNYVYINRLMRNNLSINTGKTVDLTHTITLTNFQSELTSSQFSNISNPIRIRYENGDLIFKDLYYIKNSEFTQATIIFFKQDGTRDSSDDLNNNNITAGAFTSYIPADAYYMCVIYYNQAAFYDLYINDITVDWLHDKTLIDYLENNKLTPLNFKYKKKKLKENFTLNENKGMPSLTAHYITADNVQFTDSSISDMSPLIQLKYLNGTPIINQWNWKDIPSSAAAFLWYFNKDKDLTLVKSLNSENLNVIPSDAYYCYIRYFKNLGSLYDSEFENINVEWLNQKDNEETPTYYVGLDGESDYNSIYACFDDLKSDTNKKIIYIKPGTYNLKQEILNLKGSDYLINLSTSSSTWQTANVLVPENSEVIGLGNVILNYLPEDNEVSDDALTLISPLNVIKDCNISNITINCKNCRYGIHDEAGTSVDNYYKEHKYKNVKIYVTGTQGYGQAFGSGFSAGGINYNFDECIFSSTMTNPFTIHNGYLPQNANASLYTANLTFNNCKFICPTNNTISEMLLINGEPNTQLYVMVNISNCYFKNNRIGLYRQSSGTNYLNAFKLIINNSNVAANGIIVGDNVTNNLTPEIYNSI